MVAAVKISLNALAREAITSGPVGALRAGLSVRVVDAFLVRATNDAVGDDHGLGSVLFEEGEYLLADSLVGADVDVLRDSAFERVRLAALIAHDGDNNFRREIGGWAVEGNGGDGIAAKSPPSFLAQPRCRGLPALPHEGVPSARAAVKDVPPLTRLAALVLDRCFASGACQLGEADASLRPTPLEAHLRTHQSDQDASSSKGPNDTTGLTRHGIQFVASMPRNR